MNIYIYIYYTLLYIYIYITYFTCHISYYMLYIIHVTGVCDQNMILVVHQHHEKHTEHPKSNQCQYQTITDMFEHIMYAMHIQHCPASHLEHSMQQPCLHAGHSIQSIKIAPGYPRHHQPTLSRMAMGRTGPKVTFSFHPLNLEFFHVDVTCHI